jgi:hypothetical protein
MLLCSVIKPGGLDQTGAQDKTFHSGGPAGAVSGLNDWD